MGEYVKKINVYDNERMDRIAVPENFFEELFAKMGLEVTIKVDYDVSNDTRTYTASWKPADRT